MNSSDFAGMKVHVDPKMTDTVTETFTYKGHPIIQFLAKIFRFNPDAVQYITRTIPKKDAVIFNNTLIMHPEIYDELLKSTKISKS